MAVSKPVLPPRPSSPERPENNLCSHSQNGKAKTPIERTGHKIRWEIPGQCTPRSTVLQRETCIRKEVLLSARDDPITTLGRAWLELCTFPGTSARRERVRQSNLVGERGGAVLRVERHFWKSQNAPVHAEFEAGHGRRRGFRILPFVEERRE